MNNYIFELLKEIKTLIIPGLGALTITSEKSGDILFMNYLKYDDGNLAKYIAEKDKLELNDAKNSIAKFVREILALLDKGENYDMFQFGSFTKKDGEIEFKQWQLGDTTMAVTEVTSTSSTGSETAITEKIEITEEKESVDVVQETLETENVTEPIEVIEATIIVEEEENSVTDAIEVTDVIEPVEMVEVVEESEVTTTEAETILNLSKEEKAALKVKEKEEKARLKAEEKERLLQEKEWNKALKKAEDKKSKSSIDIPSVVPIAQITPVVSVVNQMLSAVSSTSTISTGSMASDTKVIETSQEKEIVIENSVNEDVNKEEIEESQVVVETTETLVAEPVEVTEVVETSTVQLVETKGAKVKTKTTVAEKNKKAIVPKTKKKTSDWVFVLWGVVVLLLGGATYVAINFNTLKTDFPILAELAGENNNDSVGAEKTQPTDEDEVVNTADETLDTSQIIPEEPLSPEEPDEEIVQESVPEPVYVEPVKPKKETPKKTTSPKKVTYSSNSSSIGSIPTPDLSKPYHVVAGSFSSMENANRFAKQLMASGQSDVSAGESGGMYRVSLGGFSSQNSAVQALGGLRSAVPNVWVFQWR